jgi:hypothetical protein
MWIARSRRGGSTCLFALEVGNRHAHVLGLTRHSDRPWTTQGPQSRDGPAGNGRRPDRTRELRPPRPDHPESTLPTNGSSPDGSWED